MTAVRHAASTMRRARELSEAGWSPRRIQRILMEEVGASPSPNTIRCWIDPRRAERQRRAQIAKRAASASFGWAGVHPSPEWKLGRMKALRAAGVSFSGIAAVMRVDFGDDLTDEQVRYAVTTGRPPRRRRNEAGEGERR